jgi:hypothetical protein
MALSFAWDPAKTTDGLMRQQPRKLVMKASILRRQRRAKGEINNVALQMDLWVQCKYSWSILTSIVEYMHI